MESHNLIDINMEKSLLTWRNQRVRDKAIVRRLDRFLIKKHSLEHLSCYKQWVGQGGKSDHHLIYLQMLGHFENPRAPFKFNSTWLKEDAFRKIVIEHWKRCE